MFSLVLLAYAVATAALNLYLQIQDGSSKPSKFYGVVFYAGAASYCVLFFFIDWKAFMLQFERVERRFSHESYRHLISTRTLQQRMRICFVMGFAASLINQILFYSAEAQKILHTRECHWTNRSVLSDFITEHLDHIFDFLPYNHVLGVIAELGMVAISFYWSFADIFIMLVSIGIAFRFQQINKRIDYFRGRIVSLDRWVELRLDYVEVCELLKYCDVALGKIILIASLNNSYLILVQLLNIFA